MNLLLVAVLLQENAAEETFKKIEETITSAKTLSLKLTSTASSGENGGPKQAVIRGTFLLNGDKKILADFVTNENGSDQRVFVVCDGEWMQGRSPALPRPIEFKAHARFRNYLELAFARGGGAGLMTMTAIYCGLVHDARKMESDPKKMVAVSGFESGKDKDGAYIKFDSKMDHFGPRMRNTIWYDPSTYKPLKGLQTNLDQGGTFSEIYEDVILNAEIPDEKFKLPDDKK